MPRVSPNPSARSFPERFTDSSAPGRERILIVDDEPQVLVALEDLLSEDFVVLTTESPETALKMVDADQRIAVVVSDQRMPRIAGDELFAKLADSSAATRILLTGYADLSAVVRAVNEGKIFAYVTKPWNPEDLRLKVSKAVEHYRLANELSYERRLLSQVLDSLDEGVIAIDPSGETLLFNRQAEKVLGAAAHEVSPATWIDHCGVFLSDRRTRLPEELNLLARAAAGQPSKDVELFVQQGGEAGLEVVASSLPLRDEAERSIGGIAVLRDVGERRGLERQLLQAQKMEAIGQLAGGVAHDFNNLLAVMSGYAELAMEGIPDGDPKREDLSELLAAGKRAAALTRQLLAFGRRQIMQPRIIDLNEVVSGFEKMLRRIIGEDVELRTVLAPNLGAVKADPSQMEQVLLNLAVNARDAMPGGGRLTIKTANVILESEFPQPQPSITPGDFVMLSVGDTGVGMDAETQRHIFEPFFTTKEPGRGTGLGLSTVHGIVRQSQGQIIVYSEPGQGATFKVYLPREDGTRTVVPPPGRPSLRAVVNATVLVVEDDEAVRRVTARMLTSSGYRVLVANSPAEARAICRGANTVDLLLTDVVMPEISGPELATELVSFQPKMRVLYMSGYSGGAMARGKTGIADGTPCLDKPFTAHSLSAKVRETLESEAAS